MKCLTADKKLLPIARAFRKKHPGMEIIYVPSLGAGGGIAAVADTGEGLSPENMKNTFQPLLTIKVKGTRLKNGVEETLK